MAILSLLIKAPFLIFFLSLPRCFYITAFFIDLLYGFIHLSLSLVFAFKSVLHTANILLTRTAARDIRSLYGFLVFLRRVTLLTFPLTWYADSVAWAAVRFEMM